MLNGLRQKALTLITRPNIVLKTKVLAPICKRSVSLDNQHVCSMLAKNKWNGDLVSRYKRAKSYYCHIDTDSVEVVRVLGYSRSGSHNFLSRLHYLPSCFVLKENLDRARAKDRLWPSLRVGDVRPTDYMEESLFGPYGLQRKRGDDLGHLVAPFNLLLELPLRQEDSFVAKGKAVFLVRNFFRVLLSRENAVERYHKNKWALTDDKFREWANAHYKNIKTYMYWMDKEPKRFAVLSHEIFCARPRHVLMEIAEEIGIKGGRWITAEEFFVEGLDGASGPVMRDGKLWDDSAGQPILGTGGQYNPVAEPSLQRTMMDDVGAFVKPTWIDYSKRLFGGKLVDLWLTDTSDTYKEMSLQEFRELLANVP